jgi:DNA uptake protein ComE-like DNA-binding protein
MTKRDELPRPVTRADIYLHDMALSLRALVDVTAAQLAVSAGRVVVSSGQDGPPSPSGEVRGTGTGTPLPPDFPGLTALREAGINTVEAVPRTASRLKAVPGIGPATATDILKRFKKKQ